MTWTVTELGRGTTDRMIGSRKYTRVWRVVSSDIITHPIYAALRVPVKEGDLFGPDPLARCSSVRGDYEHPDQDRKHCIVIANYETPSGGGQSEENEDPTNDIPSKRWYSRVVRLPVKFGKRDNGDGVVPQANDLLAPPEGNAEPITMSNGDTPDPLPEEDFKVKVFEYQHNVRIHDPLIADEYDGAINTDRFVLAGRPVLPYQGRMTISAANAERNGIRYWVETIEIEIVDDWRLILVDEGLLKIAPPDANQEDPQYLGDGKFGTVVPILDAWGNPVKRPVKLDGNGNPLPDGADPVLLKFNTRAKPPKPFGVLGLPTDANP